MNLKLIIITLLIILILLIFIFKMVKKNRIIIKYALVWIISLLFIMFCILIPNFLQFLTKLLGFESSANMIIVLFIGFLFIISLSLTAIVSGLREKNKLLIQEISIIKSKKEREEKK